MATALLVDDNYFSRRVFEFALRWCGFEVLATKCCGDALEVWKNERSAIDFIICDVVLPDGSGTDVAVAVSKERPDLQLLFCSGTELENWSQRDRWNLTQLGSLHWEFLAKPFHIRRFKELVRKMVNSRTMR